MVAKENMKTSLTGEGLDMGRQEELSKAHTD